MPAASTKVDIRFVELGILEVHRIARVVVVNLLKFRLGVKLVPIHFAELPYGLETLRPLLLNSVKE